MIDWLASEFTASGWNVKHLVRTIVTSHTYRQTSQPRRTCSCAIREPRARPPKSVPARCRICAGQRPGHFRLLVRKIGGPEREALSAGGYWETQLPTREWESDKGENQWRRGLYTWWQRTYLHPSLVAFDRRAARSAPRKRVRSNIPQQALALLNDPTYVEAARTFAGRILRECHGNTEQRIVWAWREATSRTPEADEIAIVRELLEKHLAQFSADEKGAGALLKIGFAPPPSEGAAAEIAAWTSVARVLLNLHETITRS